MVPPRPTSPKTFDTSRGAPAEMLRLAKLFVTLRRMPFPSGVPHFSAGPLYWQLRTWEPGCRAPAEVLAENGY
jgi:hypothetical protein